MTKEGTTKIRKSIEACKDILYVLTPESPRGDLLTS
jgi:hypothetical protein